MSIWESYPLNYRTREVQAILSAVLAGECTSIIGLSGSGKSNLLGFIAHRQQDLLDQGGISPNKASFYLVDCNQLVQHTLVSFFELARDTLGERYPAGDSTNQLTALDAAITHKLSTSPRLNLLLDRFDAITSEADEENSRSILGNLRTLRDRYKYALSFVTATRRPLDPNSEIAELFFAHTLWLGPLQDSDARWSIQSYANRRAMTWSQAEVSEIIQLSSAYPSLLRAVCEAKAAGVKLDLANLKNHHAITRRVDEFWADQPDDEHVRLSGLRQNELLALGHKPHYVDTSQLTAKESLLWDWFQSHPDKVCPKDDLIQAVWPEDRIYEAGIRDDSLAQLVRRLREKVETDPSNPRYILTIPGRGYRFLPE